MNILVTLDRNYLPPLRVMLGSLLRNDPGETFEIYAIGDGLMPEDWAALEELCASRGRIHPLEVPADLFADAPVARYWTRAMYYRLLAAELLPRSLDRVLYLDPDILVINPVRALYDTDLEGDLMAAATHTGLLAGITDPVNRLRLENYEAEAYYNSGVLVMDLSAMRREVRPGDIFDYAREHADILLLPDQDVLNGLYGGQILGVDDSLWNYDARRFDRYLLLSQWGAGHGLGDGPHGHPPLLRQAQALEPQLSGPVFRPVQALPASGGAAVRAIPIHAAVFSGGRGRPPLPDGKNAGMAERSVLKQIKQAVPGFTRDRFCAWYFISSARTPDQCSRRDPPGADLRSAEPGRTAAWRTF